MMKFFTQIKTGIKNRHYHKAAALVCLLLLILSACAAPIAFDLSNAPATVLEALPVTESGAVLNAGAVEDPITLNVFAAASLTESFTRIGKAFEAANPGVKVVINFAGSQQLAQQIIQGAPADIFASANQKQMAVVVKDGRIATGSEQPFVKNRLVVIVPKDNPADIRSLHDLAKGDLLLVMAAGEVPVGQYSLEFLDKAAQDGNFGPAYKYQVLKNVASYEDNVKTVLSKVSLGEADAGIVYTSDISTSNTSRVTQIDIPDALNIIASYPIAPVQDSPNLDLAKTFIEYVLSTEGQSTLARYGFIPVKSR